MGTESDQTVIGLSSDHHPDTDGDFYGMIDDGNVYDVEDEDHHYWRNTNIDGFRQHDTISIYLDLPNSQIAFSINGGKNETVYENIKCGKGIEYKLWVSLEKVGDCIEIVNFAKESE